MILQEKQPNETTKAYSAYLVHRDGGTGRSLTASYQKYMNTIAPNERGTAGNSGLKPSSQYNKWVVDFDWQTRLDEWDGEAAQRLQNSLLEADRDEYLSKVEGLRTDVEAASIQLMKISTTSISVGNSRLLAIYRSLPTEGGFVPMGKDALEEYSTIVRSTLDAARILTIASDKLAQALGLARLVEGLNAEHRGYK
jgi:hypothetical protein